MKMQIILMGVALGVAVVIALVRGETLRAAGVPGPTPTPSTLGAPGPQVSSARGAGAFIVPQRTTDLAPQVPAEDKAEVLIRHADGTYEDVLLRPDQGKALIRNLPAGDTWVSTAPPASLMGAPHPVAAPQSGTVQGPASGAHPVPPATPVASTGTGAH